MVPRIKDGYVYPMEGPGLGVELQPAVFERSDLTVRRTAAVEALQCLSNCSRLDGAHGSGHRLVPRLGHAMAEGFAAAGATFVLNGSDPARLQRRRGEIEAKGYNVHEARFDVTNEAAVVAAFARFDAAGIAMDILVNNAGIQLRKPMVELSTAEWQQVIDTNLTSAFVVGREAAKRMIPRGRGKVINIGSLTSELARATVAPYTVAKGGIKMLTAPMAAEWAEHGIQANAIGPGYMMTDMNQALIENPTFDAWVKGRDTRAALGQARRASRTRRLSRVRASNYVNGQIIYVDGGMLAVL